MKRKLFVILALAVLLAAVWCGTAGAENMFTSFDRESPVLFPDDDGVYRGNVSWQVNFVPTAIKIYKIEGVAYTTTELVRDLPVTATSTTLEAGYRYNLFIYYGDTNTMNERVYQEFLIAKGTPSVSVWQTFYPSFLDPSEKAAFAWTLNFTPTRIEIRNADTEAVIAELPGTATSWNQFDRSIHYQIRFYHNNSHVDRTVSIQESGWAFDTQPTGGNIVPEGSLRLSWKTNFIPEKVEIGHKANTGWPSYNNEFVTDATITENLGKSMTYDAPYSFTQSSSYTVQAYYTSWDYVESADFTITKTARSFTKQPDGGNILPGGSRRVSWATNFTPVEVVIGHKHNTGWPSYNDVFAADATITENLARSMSFDIPYDFDASSMYIVQAYYSDAYGAYIESDDFVITKDDRQFTATPTGGTISPNGSLSLRWTTNFQPTQVEIGYKTGDTWNSIVTLTNNIQLTMSYLLTYNSAYETMYIRAFYDGEHYVESDGIPIEIVPRQFTLQPTGGTVYPWTTHKLRWTTNFYPTKIQIVYRESRTGTWVSKVEITTGLNRTMSYQLSYDEALNGTMYVHAFYGPENGEWETCEPISMVKQAAYACGDNLTATFENGTLTISGAGAMYDYGNLATTLPPWYPIRNEITSVVIEAGISNIGKYSFVNCANMTMAVLPVSVTSVGRNAFQNCTALRNVAYSGFKTQWDAIDIDGGNTNLLNATVSYLHRSGRLGTTNVYYELIGRDGSLWIYGSGGSTVHVTPPWYDVAQYITELRVDVDTLWEDAFRDCTGVKKVYLSDSLTLVDDGAFNDCTRLTDIYYDSTADDWDSIEILGHNEPLLNAALHTAPHEEQLTGDLSWSVNDEGLLRIWFDDSLMGDGEDTAIPDYTSYTATPWYTDYKDVITSLRIESGVTSIGRYAFSHLTKLRTIDIADTVTVVGNWSFSYCTSLEDFTLPDSVTSILAYTFQNCSYLEILHLPNSIQSMGNGVFQNCGNLEKVWLPSGITNIQTNCFYNCSLLDYVSIPATVTSIGENAFYGCTELADTYSHVYFGGSSAQWKQISINTTGNTPLVNCPKIHMTPEELRIDENHFPDAEFRGYVSTNMDADNSGWLTDEEIANTLVIQCGAIDAETLAGIEYFTELEELNCADNALTQLELSANTKLVSLECQDNAITSLSLEALPELYSLNCAGNQLTALDLSHQMLETLNCRDNQLTALDLSGQALKLLDCRNNPLTLLNLSFQGQLDILNCYGTSLAVLDLRGCPLLLGAVEYGAKTSTADYVQYQYVDNKQERIVRLRVDADTELIIPGSVRIDEARFPDDAFRAYVAAHFDTNGTGWLSENEIALAAEINAYEYDTSGMESLEGIQLFTELSYFSLADCPDLTEIDLSANTKIGDMDIWDTGLTGLNVQGMRLGSCSIARSPLTSLTLGVQPNLYLLSCPDADLTSLDISGCPLLLDAIQNGVRTEENGHVTYAGDSAELTVDADVQLITGLTMTVAFDFQNGSVPVTQEVPFGGAAEALAEPIRSRALFTGWYTDPGCAAETLYDFTAPVTANITLYAGWLIPEPSGMLTLPAILTTIEDEAFSGIAAEAVLIPDSVTSISGNPFAGSSVRYIYGAPGSAAETLAATTEGLTFVPIDDAWLTSH